MSLQRSRQVWRRATTLRAQLEVKNFARRGSGEQFTTLERRAIPLARRSAAGWLGTPLDRPLLIATTDI